MWNRVVEKRGIEAAEAWMASSQPSETGLLKTERLDFNSCLLPFDLQVCALHSRTGIKSPLCCTSTCYPIHREQLTTASVEKIDRGRPFCGEFFKLGAIFGLIFYQSGEWFGLHSVFKTYGFEIEAYVFQIKNNSDYLWI